MVIPHYDSASLLDDVIAEGMTFTVEPMVTIGSQAWEMWDDGWTVVTKDRSFTAQFEHTLVEIGRASCREREERSEAEVGGEGKHRGHESAEERSQESK